MMTKQDFELVASALRLHKHRFMTMSPAFFDDLITSLCLNLKQANENFDSGKFRSFIYEYEVEGSKFLPSLK